MRVWAQGTVEDRHGVSLSAPTASRRSWPLWSQGPTAESQDYQPGREVARVEAVRTPEGQVRTLLALCGPAAVAGLDVMVLLSGGYCLHEDGSGGQANALGAKGAGLKGSTYYDRFRRT